MATCGGFMLESVKEAKIGTIVPLHKELEQLEGYFGGDLHEHTKSEQGISEREIGDRVEWFRKNPKAHTFNEKQIGEIEEVMKKHL